MATCFGRRPGLLCVLAVATAVLLPCAAGARITIRPGGETDRFAFHASYSREPFDPATAFTLEVWNCASGAMPRFVGGPVSVVVCDDDAATEPAPATLAYTVGIPAGACVSHGRSCYYRAPAGDAAPPGLRYARVQFARRGRLNRVWIQSEGDLSAANQANMLLLVTIDAQPRAMLQDAFTPLPGGGWFSAF